MKTKLILIALIILSGVLLRRGPLTVPQVAVILRMSEEKVRATPALEAHDELVDTAEFVNFMDCFYTGDSEKWSVLLAALLQMPVDFDMATMPEYFASLGLTMV